MSLNCSFKGMVDSDKYDSRTFTYHLVRAKYLINTSHLFFLKTILYLSRIYFSTMSWWVTRYFLASSFSIISWTLSMNTFIDIWTSNQRQRWLLTAVPELLDCRLMEFRAIKPQFRTKFVLNWNQDWCFSPGIGHVKSLTIWFTHHVRLGVIRRCVGGWFIGTSLSWSSFPVLSRS